MFYFHVGLMINANVNTLSGVMQRCSEEHDSGVMSRETVVVLVLKHCVEMRHDSFAVLFLLCRLKNSMCFTMTLLIEMGTRGLEVCCWQR